MREVLIVDQDRLWVDLIREALAEQGVEARVSADGAEALQLVRTGNLAAVILSVDLRGMSGYSICNRLKKDPALARVPLLLTSAEASEETFSQHSRLKTRAEAYLRKPFDKPALWQAVAAMWEPPAAASGAAAERAAPAMVVATSWAAAGPAVSGAARPAAAAETPVASPRRPIADALQDRTHPQPASPSHDDDALPGGGTARPDRGRREPFGDDPEGEATKVGELFPPEPRPESASASSPAEAPPMPRPEVTVVRAANPEDVAASQRDRGSAAEGHPATAQPESELAMAQPEPSMAQPALAMPPGGVEAGAAAEPDDSRARLATLAAQHRSEEAAWRARLEAVQAELAAAHAVVADLQTQRERADLGLEEILRLLRAPLG